MDAFLRDAAAKRSLRSKKDYPPTPRTNSWKTYYFWDFEYYRNSNSK